MEEIKFEYDQDDRFVPTDPGNELRRLLDGATVVHGNLLHELLYTMEERGLLHYRVDEKDAMLIWQLVEMSKTMSSEDVQTIRM